MNEPLIEWIRGKLAESEQSLRSRLKMAESWKIGDDASWDSAAKMHPSTANEPRMTKADRLRESKTQERIAERNARDVEMWKTVLEMAQAHSQATFASNGG